VFVCVRVCGLLLFVRMNVLMMMNHHFSKINITTTTLLMNGSIVVTL